MKLKTAIILCPLLIFLLTFCIRRNDKAEIVTLVDKIGNRIYKGILVDGKKEGYWVTFDTNYVIQWDVQYKNDIENGKTTSYYKGSISMETEMKDGKRNGKYISYHKYPIIATQGYLKMGHEIGEWRIYTEDGRLNRMIEYEKDTFKIILDHNFPSKEN